MHSAWWLPPFQSHILPHQKVVGYEVADQHNTWERQKRKTHMDQQESESWKCGESINGREEEQQTKLCRAMKEEQ